MGYETSFKLEVDGVFELDSDEFLEELGAVTEYEDWWEFYGDKYRLDAKWYKCGEQMKTISAKYPDVLFTLRGYGEEDGDIWQSYFYDGKSVTYRPEITFPEFNEDNLKE